MLRGLDQVRRTYTHCFRGMSDAISSPRALHVVWQSEGGKGCHLRHSPRSSSPPNGMMGRRPHHTATSSPWLTTHFVHTLRARAHRARRSKYQRLNTGAPSQGAPTQTAQKSEACLPRFFFMVANQPGGFWVVLVLSWRSLDGCNDRREGPQIHPKFAPHTPWQERPQCVQAVRAAADTCGPGTRVT